MTDDLVTPAREAPNLLHMVCRSYHLFATGNVAEAAPGAHAPLGWTIWGGLTEEVLGRVVTQLGAWPHPPDAPNPDQRFGCIFFRALCGPCQYCSTFRCRARHRPVIDDANSAQANDLEPGDVLGVPDYRSFVGPANVGSRAVVIDIGGSLSLGAIVARARHPVCHQPRRRHAPTAYRRPGGG